MRDPSVQQGRRGLRPAAAQGRDLFGRPGLGDRRGQPARAAGGVRGRRADPRHLLRPADAGAAARRQGRGRPCPRVRPRRCRDQGAEPAVRGRLGDRRALSGLDEPRRPRHRAAGGLQGRRHLGQRALRHRGRRGAPLLHASCSTPRWCTRRTAQAAAELRAQHRRAEVGLDDVGLSPRDDRQDPRQVGKGG